MARRAGINYRKLPGRSKFFSFVLSCLYLGPDHVLAVQNSRFSENYKRFYFSDIQAIVIRKDRRLFIWAAVQVVMILAFLGIGLSVHSEAARVFWLVVVAACVVSLAVNLLKGPTCACHVLTAVQEERLPSLNRVRVARKVIDRFLEPLIQGAQGSLNPGEPVEAAASGAITHRRGEVFKDMPGKAMGAGARTDYRGLIHVVAFLLFAICGVLTTVELFHHGPAAITLSWLAGTAGAVFLVIALVKQRSSRLPGGVRKAAWAAFFYVCLSVVLGYYLAFAGTAFSVRTHTPTMTQWDVVSTILHLSPESSPAVMVVYAMLAAGALGTGLCGLFLTLRYRSTGGASAAPSHMEEMVYKA